MVDHKKLSFLIVLFLFSINLIVWQVVFSLNKKDSLEIIFFDVGQGDSIFIETPYQNQILIDGGPDSNSELDAGSNSTLTMKFP